MRDSFSPSSLGLGTGSVRSDMIMMRQRCLVLALTALALSLYSGNRRLAYAQVPPKQLYFTYLSSFSGGFESSGSVPAVELALRQIALNTSILPGYVLDYTGVRDTQCDRTESLNTFFQEVQSEPTKIGLIGCGCSVASEPVAEIVHHWNISQVSYSSAASELSNRRLFPYFFRTYPSDANFIPAIRSVIEYYGWKRIAFITQAENLFIGTFSQVNIQLQSLGIEVTNQMFPSHVSPLTRPDLFGEADDYRVFFVNTYADPAREIVCEAYKRGLVYPRYAWITYGWYQEGWWTEEISAVTVTCSDTQIASFMERILALQIFPDADDVNALSDTGLTPRQFNHMYISNLTVDGVAYNFSFVAALAYDAVWSLAIALDKTARMEEGDVTGTGCEAMEGELVDLDEFNYTNARMGCLIRWNLQQTDFMGVSGPVQLDGSRIQTIVRLLQYRLNGSSVVVSRERIGFHDRTAANGSDLIEYLPGEDEETVYPEGIPPDGTPHSETVTFHLSLVIIYDVLAAVGIGFAFFCLTFNFTYRNKKIVRLTSPNLNYFIIAGAIILYCSVFIRLIPSVDETVNDVRCNLQVWLNVVGYLLGYGTILVKMGRVYQIFHNPTMKKKALKDWHLMIAVVLITGIGVLLLMIGTAVPDLRPSPMLDPDEEDLEGSDELGVTINYYVWQCYDQKSSASFIWLFVIFVYLAALQIVGLVLAFQTRKVKVKILNDSKYVATLVYISSIVLVVLALVTFTLGAYINVGELTFSGGIIVATTMLLVLIFVPKMVSLYRDPTGERVFDKSNPSSVVEVSKHGVLTVKTPEGKMIARLEARVKELEEELHKCQESMERSVNGQLATPESDTKTSWPLQADVENTAL